VKYYIQTLGCAMNYSDSERISSILEKIGYEKTDNINDTDLYLFNTCSIRQKGEDRVYGQMRKLNALKKKNPRLKLGITGCMVRETSTRNSEDDKKDKLLSRLSGLDFVFKTTDAHRLNDVLSDAELNLPENENRLDYLQIAPKYTTGFQAFVPIQIGCDKFCTYCIVPYARGREESRSMDEILLECTKLVENGCKEITLVGQTVNSYGKSTIDKMNKAFDKYEDPFVELLARVDKLHEKGLNRVRFTSPHPKDLTDALIKAHAELKTLTPHIHLPVQAGDDETLQRMNRKYTVEHYKQLVSKIRKTLPGCSVTTDIIVGFCAETDQQFENTYELYKEIRWDMAYIARYSERPGTVSSKAFEDDISREVKAKRWHRLNDILTECSLEYHKNMEGKTYEVLVESHNKETGECEGKCRENKVIQFKGTPDLVGKIIQVQVIKGLEWLAKGEKVG
jgi:tRNA-2-methylthio-N6-dimethylallyladenosine synthase